ncbi:MAG: 5'-methylthioadenosine/S-adenosylhomocysteine nucleosidase [SAR324 cluster bacterium]|nr:5'-methylthioadenosine/S-adenosylhomocysteine nucleosidase [SAR324 cluster bacterium]
MAMIGIVCPLWAEAKPLLAWHPKPRIYKFKGYTWISLEWQQQSIVIVHSRIGKMHAVKATELLIQHHSPRLLINFGSAGAISQEVSIGSVVVASATAEYQQTPPDSLLVKTDSELLELVHSIPQILTGPIVSADQNIESDFLKQELFFRYQALCGDWESAVVMKVCEQHQISALAFRVVSDFGDAEALSDFKRHHAYVLFKAAPLLEQFLNLWLSNYE